MLDELKKIAIRVNGGSGCLLHTGGNYDYVLTARHCIADFPSVQAIDNYTKDVRNVNVSGEVAANIFEELVVLDYFISDRLALDIAIIIVASVEAIPVVEYQSAHYRQKVTIYGYPHMRAEESDPRESLECEVELCSTVEDGFDLRANTTLASFNKDAKENVEGFSGSGIFELQENSVHLLGIVTELKNFDGGLNKIRAVKIQAFNELLAANTFNGEELRPLVPAFLLGFENYISELFSFNNPVLTEIMAEQAQSVSRAGATPKSIADFLNEKIFIPHSKGMSVNHPALWQGWIEFLTYLSFDELEDKFCNLPQSLLRPSLDKPKKYFFYLVEGKQWGDVIRYLLMKSDKRFKSGSRFFINNDSAPLRPHVLPPDLVDRIVKDIGTAEDIRLTSKKLQIHQTSLPSAYSFVHLQEFANIFTNHTFSSIRDAQELKNQIQAALKEVLFHA